nr:SAM-dependent methyltransferase [Salirhabdus salicampi]
MGQYFIETAKLANIPLHICELGGGSGRFASQVCQQLANVLDGDVLRYSIIEENPSTREKWNRIENNIIKDSFASLEEFSSAYPAFCGFIFSNEFLDAQPVRIVEMLEDTLYEICVTEQHGQLTETKRLCPTFLRQWMEERKITIKNGYRCEVPLYISSITANIAKALRRGFILTIDYGYNRDEWMHPARKQGSLRGYSNHQLKSNVLENVGEMDITHHVHWDVWIEEGRKYDIEFHRLMKQSEFLIHYGIMERLESHQSQVFSAKASKNRAIRSFILGDLGSAFDVCIQAKGEIG